MEAKLYTVQENFEFRGVKRVKGDTFRITDEKAEGLGEKVRLSDDQSVSSSSLKAPASSPENKESDPASLPQNMPEASKYKVVEAFELEGVNRETGSEIELTDEKAAELGEKVEKIEAIPEGEGEGEDDGEGDGEGDGKETPQSA